MTNRHHPRYIDDADFTTNAPSYYEDLARKEKLIRLLAERIWGYEKILDETLEEIQERFRAWDKNLEDFPEDVKVLLQQWLDNGSLDHIINDTIFNWKLDTAIFEQFRDTVTAQLQHIESVKIGGEVKTELENLSPTVLGAIDGSGGPFNLLSVPQDYSTSPIKTTFLDTIVVPLNPTNGRYVNYQGVWTDSLGFNYSAPISLTKGQTLNFEAAGYETQVGMISLSDSEGIIQRVLKRSTSSSVSIYSYTAENNCFVVLSWDKNKTSHAIKYHSVVENDNFQLSEIKNMKKIVGIKNNEIIEVVPGSYVASNGTIVTLNSFSRSQPIHIKKGDTVEFTATGYLTAVSMIARSDADGNILSSLVNSIDSTARTYSYTSQEDDIIVLSWYAREAYSLTIYNNTNVRLNNVENALNVNNYYTIGMFTEIGVCGDSYVKGALYNEDGLVGDRPNSSWGAVLGRLNGLNVEVYASSGADTNTFQTRSDCLPKLLADTPKGLYVFCMGINDYTYVPRGTLADMKEDWTQNPNTFYGNYGRIIKQVQNHAPNAKIIIMTPFYKASSEYQEYALTPVTEISDFLGVAMIDTADSQLAQSRFFMEGLLGGHPTTPLYSAMAADITDLISKCIQYNYDYFKGYSEL